MNTNVESLSLLRFNKRIKELAESIREAKVTMVTLKEAAAKNVENQKILNAHLAARNLAYRKLSEPAVRPTLSLVSNSLI